MTLPRCPTASQREKKIGLFRCGEDAKWHISTLCTSAQQSCPYESSTSCGSEKNKQSERGAGLPHCTLPRLLGKSTKTVVPCRQKVALLFSGSAILTGSLALPSSTRLAHVATSPESALPTKHPVFQHSVRADRSAE